MTASVTVWDQKTDPPHDMGDVLCWQSYAHGGQVCSVPRYLEDHADRMKAKYLAFIHDLGELRVRGKRVVDHLDLGDGFSLWWMTGVSEKSPYKSPEIYGCLRLLALEEILLERKPSTLHGISEDRSLELAVRQLCRTLRIDVTWEKPRFPTPWSLRRLSSAFPYPMQGLISLARYLVARWPLRRNEPPPWFSGDGAVFLCSYFIHLDHASCADGRFYSRQWGALPEQLHDGGTRTNWLQQFLFSALVPDVGTGIDWLRRFNRDAIRQGCHAFLDTYLSWRIVTRVLRRWFRLNAAGWRLRKLESAFDAREPASWLWPMLRNDWRSSLAGPGAMSNCLWVALFDAALDDVPHQNVGLYLCEGQSWECAFLGAWRKHGHGEVIGVAHTTVPFWHLPYFSDPRSAHSDHYRPRPLPDRLAVNGPAARTAVAGPDNPIEQVVDVEALQYLNLSRVARSTVTAGQCSVVKQLGLASPRHVLVLGDMVAASTQNLLGLLEGAMTSLPSGWSFTFKPHPGYAADLADYPGVRADETTEALDRILTGYDVALAANGTSSAVDAYQVGLPVIITLNGDALNLSPLRGEAGVRFVSTPDELADALLAAARGEPADRGRSEFFFLDPDLPRWQQLLSTAKPTSRAASCAI